MPALGPAGHSAANDPHAKRAGSQQEHVQVESISPHDLNPDPDARSKWQQQIFLRRAARFKAMYGN